MNYVPGAELKQIPCWEFVKIFNQMRPETPWEDVVQPKIHDLVRSLFESALKAKSGIRPFPNGTQLSKQKCNTGGICESEE